MISELEQENHALNTLANEGFDCLWVRCRRNDFDGDDLAFFGAAAFFGFKALSAFTSDTNGMISMITSAEAMVQLSESTWEKY
ncbi:hypothetical protein TorRG33x02_161160 [Trema orientale]|uniref:Uncharacterized protein n=1 Tax=Trema orientale TaxID=63057 RepID=A0A2P5ERB4_TREOI|nr:hypothetical protein TorRG33x02_161160 [Trema orientale]